MLIKDCVIKNKFDWWLVYADMLNGKVKMTIPNGYTIKAYAYAVTLNWSKKLGVKMICE